jgi:uncharacterized metal-binding protein YceD (DUF177 family)
MTDSQTPEGIEAPAPVFSHLYPVERLPGEGRVVKLAPSEQERAAIADLLGLGGLPEFTAKVTLKSFAGGEMVRVTGSLSAHVLQTCGITLEPVESDVCEDINRVFAFTVPESDNAKEMELDPEGAEPPDPVIEGHIDLGEVVVQQLSLGLDPFPRAPGAEFDPPKGVNDPVQASPFAVLAGLGTGKSPKS